MPTSRLIPKGHCSTVLLCALTVTGFRSEANGSALPDEVVASLRRNAERLGPVTVSYTQQYETPLDPKQALERIGLADRSVKQFFFKAKHQVAWKDGKIYASLERYDSGFVCKDENSFDGKVVYVGSHNSEQPILFKRFLPRVVKEMPAAGYLKQAFFQAAGFHFPGGVAEWEQPRAESELLHLLERDGTLESVENVERGGRRLLRVSLVAPNPAQRQARQVDLEREAELLKSSKETPARQKELLDALRRQQQAGGRHRFVFDLDPALAHAVEKWEEWDPAGVLVRRCDCGQFKQLPGREVWLPQRCEVRYHQFDWMPGTHFKEPILSDVFQVSAIDAGPIPDDRFALVYNTPGSHVCDGTLPDAAKLPDGYVTYTVPAQLSYLDQVIESARKGIVFNPPSPPNPWRRGLIAVNVVLFAGAVVYWVWIRRSRTVQG